MTTVDDVKKALGIPPEDTSHDEEIQSAIDTTYTLIWSYIGYDMSDTETELEYEYSGDSYRDRVFPWYTKRTFVHMPIYPVSDVVEVRDENSVLLQPSTYRLVKSPGRVEFFTGLNYDFLTFKYKAGMDPLPADIDMVVQNIAISIYNSGGTFTSTASNPLKSLTMFDAMSMSFDTGSSATTGGASGALSSWSFVLDKYRVNAGPVLK